VRNTQRNINTRCAESSTCNVTVDGTFGNHCALNFECIGTKLLVTDTEGDEGACPIVENGIYVEPFHRNISSEDETIFLLV
jgi:hypothetical protein